MFAIFRDFRRLVDALRELVTPLRELAAGQNEAGRAVDRIEALELSRAQFEAEVQGALLEAKGKLKAALNSEARERQLRKHNERITGTIVDDGEEVAEGGDAVLSEHVAAGEAERMQALRVDVARNPKAAAIAAKWSR